MILGFKAAFVPRMVASAKATGLLCLVLLALAGCSSDRQALRRDRGLDRSGNPELWRREFLRQQRAHHEH